MAHTILLLLIIFLISIGQISLFMFPVTGLFINGLLVLFFLLMAIYDVYDLYAEDTLVLSATIPAISIGAIALQINSIELNVLVIYAMLSVIAVGYSLKLRIKHRIFSLFYSYGLLIALLVGVFSGIVLSAIHTTTLAFTLPLFLSLPLIIIAVIIEELFFRALLQNSVSLMTEPLFAAIFTPLFYTLFHANTDLFSNVVYFIISLIACTLYAKWKTLLVPILFSLSLNIAYYFLTQKLFLVGLSN